MLLLLFDVIFFLFFVNWKFILPLKESDSVNEIYSVCVWVCERAAEV